MISVIIPAHNEQTVMTRSLAALTDGAAEGEVEVIIVANGCSDHTASVAREWAERFGRLVQVIETPVGNKVHALNLGDAAASGFPRFYIDADVCLALADLRRMADLLDDRASEGRVLAVAPRFRMALAGCSWCVRAFYDINSRLPSSREGIGGSGVYGLSRAGRSRFDQFPNLTADDGFVRVQFAPHERCTAEDCFSTVFAPRTLVDLIRIKTRSHFGSMELRRRLPELWVNMGAGNGSALKLLLLLPWLWPKLAVYGYVKVMARWRARRKLKRLNGAAIAVWERDETSREGSP